MAFWLLVGLPARLLGGGDAALVYSGTALLLCLVPAVLTLLWADSALKGPIDQQLVFVMGSTGMRMFVVLGSAWALYASVPYYQAHAGFWVWVLVGYLFTLALDLVLLTSSRPAPESKSLPGEAHHART
jgi:hypothetical protein